MKNEKQKQERKYGKVVCIHNTYMPQCNTCNRLDLPSSLWLATKVYTSLYKSVLNLFLEMQADFVDDYLWVALCVEPKYISLQIKHS